jgi:hypothetical protein
VCVCVCVIVYTAASCWCRCRHAACIPPGTCPPRSLPTPHVNFSAFRLHPLPGPHGPTAPRPVPHKPPAPAGQGMARGRAGAGHQAGLAAEPVLATYPPARASRSGRARGLPAPRCRRCEGPGLPVRVPPLHGIRAQRGTGEAVEGWEGRWVGGGRTSAPLKCVEGYTSEALLKDRSGTPQASAVSQHPVLQQC